jgi:anthranilate/para-aminobenzoate synthase component I
VADSDPEREHEECLQKIAALAAAIDVAETGRYGR